MVETIARQEDFERALGADAAVIYKYSPACAVSAVAKTQIDRFVAEHPETPVYELNVQAEPRLAQEVAERLAVEHKSPQVILLRGGRSVWAATHYGIRAIRLANVLEDTA